MRLYCHLLGRGVPSISHFPFLMINCFLVSQNNCFEPFVLFIYKIKEVLGETLLHLLVFVIVLNKQILMEGFGYFFRNCQATGTGTWDLGLGTWDLGLGPGDLGLGTWDLGPGTWDLGPGT